MDLDFPEELILKKNKEIINKVLQKKVLLKVKKFSLEENYKNNTSHIICVLDFQNGGVKKVEIEASGKGIVDALFNAILNEYANKYISLKNIKLYDFIVKVQFNKSKKKFRTDAPVEIKIVLESLSKRKLYFKYNSNSLVKAAIGAICQAFTYLINAELAVLQLHKAIADARERQRMDLETTYTNQLVELVKVVSYHSTIEKEQNE